MSPRPELPPALREFLKSVKDLNLSNPAHVPAVFATDKQKFVNDLERSVNSHIQINLGSWKEEIDQAINQAVYPSRPESRLYWYIALAGNLLWAATCFLSPPAGAAVAAGKYMSRFAQGSAAGRAPIATVPVTAERAAQAARGVGSQTQKGVATAAEAQQTRVIQIMSVAGATVGSGSVEQAARASDATRFQPEDGKDIVRGVVGVRRAELEDMYKGMRGPWALELYGLAMWEAAAGHDQEPLEMYDEYIWMKMFPRVPYDHDRFNVIRETAKGKVEGTLKDYDLQWQRWVTAPMMPQYHQAEAQWAMGTLAVVPKNRVFRPNLKLDLD